MKKYIHKSTMDTNAYIHHIFEQLETVKNYCSELSQADNDNSIHGLPLIHVIDKTTALDKQIKRLNKDMRDLTKFVQNRVM